MTRGSEAGGNRSGTNAQNGLKRSYNSPSDTWSYWPDPVAGGVEYGFWQGTNSPSLALHFHEASQLTIVLDGSRVFQLGGGQFHVSAGQCLYIPPMQPHKSLPLLSEPTSCINVYLTNADFGRSFRVFDIKDLVPQGGDDPLMLSTLVDRRLAEITCAEQQQDGGVVRPDYDLEGGGIGDVAACYGLSREAFSRKFSRDFGMPPHAYRVVMRLNQARVALRAGAAIASVAEELGFADQSHFGRHFRRIFGTTPFAYREAMRAAQPF
jgi:AraC-like DNA-binding protein